MADHAAMDPLGRRITLHERTWLGHILPGHPEMAGLREGVMATISQPEMVRMSRSDANVRLYFGPGPRPTVKILVAVDVEQRLVKTAHLCKRISGGDIEWPS